MNHPALPAGAKVAHIRRPGQHPPRGVITVVGDGKSIALAFCAPCDAWSRDRGLRVALARLAGNPIGVEQTRGADVIAEPDILRAATSLVQERPGWTRSPDPESTAWDTTTIGPDGSMFHFCIVTKARLPDVPAPRAISWLRIPSWAPLLIQEST